MVQPKEVTVQMKTCEESSVGKTAVAQLLSRFPEKNSLQKKKANVNGAVLLFLGGGQVGRAAQVEAAVSYHDGKKREEERGRSSTASNTIKIFTTPVSFNPRYMSDVK